MIIKNKTYKKGLGLIAAGVLAIPLAATQCGYESREKIINNLEKITQLEVNEIKKTKNEEYSFERFKKALEDRYEGPFKWSKASEDDKKFYCLTYENPDEVIKEFTKEGKEKNNILNPYELPFQKLMEYEKVIPWRLIPSKLELSEESDKLMIFTIYSFNNK